MADVFSLCVSTINASNRHGGKGLCIQYCLEENVSSFPHSIFSLSPETPVPLVGKLVGPQSQSDVTAWYPWLFLRVLGSFCRDESRQESRQVIK